MTEDQIRSALMDRKLSVVAERTKLSVNTLHRIIRGEVKPHRATLAILSLYLSGES